MVKPTLRTKSIGTKVTEEEYARLEQAAQAGAENLRRVVPRGDVSKREWKIARRPKSVGVEFQALMAELMALRTILLNVIYKQANGERLTAEEMQRLIERADADKIKKAAERLRLACKAGLSLTGRFYRPGVS